MPTRPVEAYWQGREARKANPTVTTWEGLLPYSGSTLVWAWLDGWRDEVGDYHYTVKGVKMPFSDVVGAYGGVCPECWGLQSMTDLPDGILRCMHYTCRNRNWPPVDREKVPFHMGQRDAGAYI